MNIDFSQVNACSRRLRDTLLARRTGGSHWRGCLSPSALSTATAVFALSRLPGGSDKGLIRRGLRWIAENQNADGGWGDTPKSPSNLPATLLSTAALQSVARGAPTQTVQRARSWLNGRLGGLEPAAIAGGVYGAYGRDRSFSVPILTMCAMAGLLGEGRSAWKHVRPLPFELAAVPPRLYRFLRLQVVSYAVPALVAMGQARFYQSPPANPPARLIRRMAGQRTLKILREMQPKRGGFLEAVPLTAFVVMGLEAAGQAHQAAVAKGRGFLEESARADGSWPIDTDLSVWVTTLAVKALCAADGFGEPDRAATAGWLLEKQFCHRCRYTNSPPGGWGWTDLPGSVPDADDTAGAIAALRLLRPADKQTAGAAAAGIEWLANLQNRDGGIPTFCRGWNRLPFDRSAADLTAHFAAAASSWPDLPDGPAAGRIAGAVRRALRYLAAAQCNDGSWVPLWFGCEHAPGMENRVFGTARVLSCLADVAESQSDAHRPMADAAVRYLVSAQNADGGWGPVAGISSSIEETASAVEALARWIRTESSAGPAVCRGTGWLLDACRDPENLQASAIGLYFARLWYYEQLYPLVFSLAALNRVKLGSHLHF